jgi:hypothetical protein
MSPTCQEIATYLSHSVVMKIASSELYFLGPG